MQTGYRAAIAAALMLATAAHADSDWIIRFEGHDAAGPVSGVLTTSLAQDGSGIDEIGLIDGGIWQHTFAGSSNMSTVTLTSSTGITELRPFHVSFVAHLHPDGSSQLHIGWSEWPVQREIEDWYGITGPLVSRSGLLKLGSTTDELYTHMLGPWQSLTGIVGQTTYDESAYTFRNRSDTVEVPGFTRTSPFTVTAISSVPEPAAWHLSVLGVTALLLSRGTRTRMGMR